jgi:hypothetical protein
MHLRSSEGHELYKANVDEIVLWVANYMEEGDVLLYECASPHLYRGAHKKALSWMIFNSAMMSVVHSIRPDMLVAPSSKWTKGLPEKVRQATAGCTARNHDLRECECMIYFYQKHPELWTPYLGYLEAL